jgi:hypothetical protein
MEQVAKGADKIIASPATIEKLRNQGLPLESAPAPTLEERFEARKASAKDVVQFLPELPPVELVPPAIKSLYEEILDCILFGLNGAAITLSGNLIEFALKHAAFVKEAGGYQTTTPIGGTSLRRLTSRTRLVAQGGLDYLTRKWGSD